MTIGKKLESLPFLLSCQNLHLLKPTCFFYKISAKPRQDCSQEVKGEKKYISKRQHFTKCTTVTSRQYGQNNTIFRVRSQSTRNPYFHHFRLLVFPRFDSKSLGTKKLRRLNISYKIQNPQNRQLRNPTLLVARFALGQFY